MARKIKNPKIKIKKLSWDERKNSFEFFAPVSGQVVPMTQSFDPIMRRGDMGIGFAINNYKEDKVVSPINGTVLEVFEYGTGYTITNSEETIFFVIKLSGKNNLIHYQGIVPIVKPGDKIQRGKGIVRIDREYLETKNYDFQLTVAFVKPENRFTEDQLFDILYTYKNKNREVEQRKKIGRVYIVDVKKAIDY